MNPEPILSLENITVKFGPQTILKNISFSVRKGGIVGIIGPNGCGKTTLLNALSGYAPINDGKIFVESCDISSMKNFERARQFFGRSFQNVGVFKEMTVAENLMMAVEREKKLPWHWMFSKKRRASMDHEIGQILKDLDLLHHKESMAGVLSGGQLRLLELARLQILKKPILLIDEPTAGVAPILRKQLAERIRILSQQHGHTILVVEHDLKFLFDLVDRVIVMVEGEIYMQGKPEEVKNNARLQEVYFGK